MSAVKVGFAGMSHLGLVSAAAAASKGHDVVGYDPDAALCAALTSSTLPVHEPGLADLLATPGARVRFSANPADLSSCDVVVVARDVPTDAADRSDLAPVTELLDRVAFVAKPGAAVVMLSQVNPGYTRAARARIEARGALLYYQVETLIFGRAVHQAVTPERFIVGCADPAAPLVQAFAAFLASFGCPVLPMCYESAELCKISINMFLIAQVSTTNMLADICERVGAEWHEIEPALRLDRRIGQYAYLGAGLGIGGGNLQRDMATIASLASEHGADAGLVEAWAQNSRYRRDWALRTLHREVIAPETNPAIGVWGLAYKENTQSTRNSPAMHLLDALSAFDVAAYDPAAVLPPGALPHVHRAPSALDACRRRDALVVMTPWPEFAGVDVTSIRGAMRGTTVIDPFGVLDSTVAAAHGLRHFRLGTGPPSC